MCGKKWQLIKMIIYKFQSKNKNLCLYYLQLILLVCTIPS